MQINSNLVDAEDDIEETFAYARMGTRGAAKFKTEDAMWDFLTTNKGGHEYEHEGRRLYVRAGESYVSSDDLKEKAVRKVVRALIEREGGDGKTAKAKIDAKYPWGAVWWKGTGSKWEKVAQWNAQDRTMQMMGTAAALQENVDKLMD